LQYLKLVLNKTARFTSKAEGYRGSYYRGVSINGYKFQVFVFIKNKKFYIGQTQTEDEAARLFDEFMIVHQGKNAETNFDYKKVEVERIIAKFLSNNY
jgi:hypothetical protein